MPLNLEYQMSDFEPESDAYLTPIAFRVHLFLQFCFREFAAMHITMILEFGINGSIKMGCSFVIFFLCFYAAHCFLIDIFCVYFRVLSCVLFFFLIQANEIWLP